MQHLHESERPAHIPVTYGIEYCASSWGKPIRTRVMVSELSYRYDSGDRRPPDTGRTSIEGRHHVHESIIQKTVYGAVRKASLTKHATCHTIRHSFSTQLRKGGYDIRTVQELLCHSDAKTTMIYTHVLNRGPSGVRSRWTGFETMQGNPVLPIRITCHEKRRTDSMRLKTKGVARLRQRIPGGVILTGNRDSACYAEQFNHC